jgi:hypothetical protein
MSFIPFQEDDSVISTEDITAGLWTNNLYNLTTFFTSSVQEASNSGKFYLNVYNSSVGSVGSEVQFAVAYGNMYGSGSALFNNLVNEKSPTRDIYGQFRNIVYGDEGSSFNFGSSANVGSSCAPISVNTAGSSRDIFAISVNRSRYKEKINTGTWNLTLTNGGTTIQLTDNSKDSSTTNFINGNRFYYIVSGSNGNSYNATAVQTASGSYGLFFPDMGILILNPRALSLSSANFGIGITVDETAATSYTSSYNINNFRIFKAISGSSFQANSQETLASRYFFVNAKSSLLNYTTNPSIIDNNGNILYPTLIDSPQVFPTTIGLYNDANELLAVAKLSKPLPKDFTKQITCRVKLEF